MELLIDGVISSEKPITEDQMYNKIIKFIESEGWTFGGITKDITHESPTIQADAEES